MAQGATGYAESKRGVPGDEQTIFTTLTFGNTYGTGSTAGATVSPAALGLGTIRHIAPGTASNGMATSWDATNQRIRLYATYATESTDVDRSTVTVPIRVYGY